MTTVRLISNAMGHNDSVHIAINKCVVWSSVRKPITPAELMRAIDKVIDLANDCDWVDMIHHEFDDHQFEKWQNYVL